MKPIVTFLCSSFQAGPWTPEATVEHPEAVGHLSLSSTVFCHCLKSTSKVVKKSENKMAGAPTAQGIPQGWIRRDAGEEGLLPK